MNMQNSYVEQIIKRKDPAYAMPAKVGAVVLCMLGFMISMATWYGFVLLIAAAVLTYFVWLNMKVEYEYLYIDGDFSVDKILNKTKRKKVLESGKADLIMVAPKDSSDAKDAIGQNVKVMDLTSGDGEKKAYAYVFQQGSERRAVLIEPSEDLLNHIRYFTPSKVKLY